VIGSLASLVGRKERFRWLGLGISPSRDKCGGHRLAATGEFEERLEAVVREASQCGALRSLGEEREPKPILFIDEIHLLLGAGSASGSMDAAGIHKPALGRSAFPQDGYGGRRERMLPLLDARLLPDSESLHCLLRDAPVCLASRRCGSID
jgi:hypothetical protein